MPTSRFETGYLLADVTRLLRAAVDGRMSALGLTGASWRVLAYLGQTDGLSQIALARRLEMSRVALGEMVDRLEKSGHVERRADPTDRRIWRIFLTPMAQRLVPSLRDATSSLRELVFQDLSDVECRALDNTLERLRSRLQEITHAPADDDPHEGDGK